MNIDMDYILRYTSILCVFIWCVSFCLRADGLCRDTNGQCYPDVGDLGWYADWCDASHPYVTEDCPYMCAVCSHEVYNNSALHYSFDKIIGNKFQSRHGGMQSEDVSRGMTVDPGGRSGGAVHINHSKCLNLGDFKGNCVSDPGMCTTGMTYSFFFAVQAESTDTTTLLTTGAHESSRGVYFGYIPVSDEFVLTMRTEFEDYYGRIPRSNFHTDRTVLVHFAFTWSPGNDLKIYIGGSLWSHVKPRRSKPDVISDTTVSIRPDVINNTIIGIRPDKYSDGIADKTTQLMLACNRDGDDLVGYLKMDELAVWVRELTPVEIQLISNPNVAINNSTYNPIHITPSPPSLGEIHNQVKPVMNATESDRVFSELNSTIKSESISSTSLGNINSIFTSMAGASLVDGGTTDVTKRLISTVSDIVDSLLRPDNYEAWEEFSETEPDALPSLLQAVDKVLEKITDILLDDNNAIDIQHVRDNFEVSVKSSLGGVEKLTFTEDGSVTLTANVTSTKVALVSNVFRGIGEIFPMDHNVRWSKEYQRGALRMGDHIMGVSLYPRNTSDQKHINLTFDIEKVENATVVPKCVYLDFSDTDDASWSDEGCVTHVIETEVVCSCDHLTNFAILMQVIPVKLSKVDQHALEVITFVGCTMSLLGAILTVLTFLFLKIYTDRVLIHLNLAVAIIGAQILLLVEDAINRGTSACMAVTVLLYYFNMAVFTWMLVEGVHLWMQVVVVFTSESRMRSFYALGWGVPFLLASVIVPIFHSTLGRHGVCWVSPHDNSIWAFVVPALLVIMTNFGILVAVMRVILNLSAAMDEKKIKSIKTAVKSSILLLPLLGCTWVFGVLTVSSHTVMFQYVFAATNSFQGLLIFICHCIYNSEVRDVFLRRKSTWDLSRQLKTHGKVEPMSGIRPSSFRAPHDTRYERKRSCVITPPTGSSDMDSLPDSDSSRGEGRNGSLPSVCD